MFPTHVCFNKQLVIEHCGDFLQHELGLTKRRTTKITDIFTLLQPEDVPLTFKGIQTYLNSLFIFQIKQTLQRNEDTRSAKYHAPLALKGQMMLVNNGNHLLYMNSPHITTVRGLLDTNIYLSDMQRHDATRDLVMLNQSRISQQELNKKLEETVRKMKRLADELEVKKAQTDHLLFECMPPAIADQMRTCHSVPSQEFTESTCLQCDMPNFALINSQCEPKDIVQLMSDIFHRYDRLIDLHGCYKVLSLMDSYFIISGVPNPTVDHADRIMNLAIGMIMEAKQITVPKLDLPVMLRIGIHSGPVVAGVIGKTKIRYCVMGETVNVAKRLAQFTEPGRILVTNVAKLNASKSIDNNFDFSTRGYINIGNNQATCTFYLEQNTRKSVWEIIGRPKGEKNTVDGYKELHSAHDIEAWEIVESKNRRTQPIGLPKPTRNAPVQNEKLRKIRENWTK
ncbi:Protein GCY-37, partial [Aphelenchoides avenae]